MTTAQVNLNVTQALQGRLPGDCVGYVADESGDVLHDGPCPAHGDAEPFVRDPESWQAVAAAGRKYA
jgi:hypothetical protein